MILDVDYGGVHPEEHYFTNVKIPCMPLCEATNECDEIGSLWLLIPNWTWRAAVGATISGERICPVCVAHFNEFIFMGKE